MNMAIRKYRETQLRGRAKFSVEKMTEQFLPLIRKVAYRIAHRLPACVDINDLFSAGVLGFMDALEKFDPDRGKKFETYAEFRIKGAILDELRSTDYMSRTSRRKANKLAKAVRELEHELGRPPDERELAANMGLNDEEMFEMRQVSQSATFISLEDLGLDSRAEAQRLMQAITNTEAEDPYANIYLKNLKTKLSREITKLPDRLKLVISLYYQSELNYKEIGAILGVSESRISQLHNEAVQHIRKGLRDEL